VNILLFPPVRCNGSGASGDDARVEDFPADSFLGGLDATEMAALRTTGRSVRVRSGNYLCREGEVANGVWFMLAGTVKLTKVAPSGREALLELRGPGEIVGEMGAIDGQTRSADVVALSAVDALVVSVDQFLGLMRSRALFATRLAEVLVARVRQASSRQLELGTVDVMGRVCARLAEVVQSRGESTADGVLVRGITQHDLAAWVGTSRDSVVRVLRQLRNAGLAESGRGRLLVRDVAAVRALAAANPMAG
jgi:CRP-like cAMP-binding protein